jgi:hypothetical protein
MIAKKIATVFFLFCCLQATAQKIMIGGEETARPLTWDDFKGKPDKESPFFAYTFWNIGTRYDAFQFKGDTVDWKVTVIYELGKDSWKKKDKTSDSLLKHEQDHFDIGRICAAELQSKINSTVFLRSNYQTKITLMVNECISKCKKMNYQYDEETNHGGKRDQQLKWDAFVKEELEKIN